MFISKFIPRKIILKIRKNIMDRWQLEPIHKSPIDSRVAYEIWNFSPEDDPGKPNEYLIDTALDVFKLAKDIKLNDIIDRFPNGHIEGLYPNLWPGDHYRLLAAFVKFLKPLTVIEIGTSLGISALALKKYLPSNGKIYTYDIIPVNETKIPLLSKADFSDERLKQIIGNLAENSFFKTQETILKKADLIFIDAVKDIITEEKFIENFEKIRFDKPVLMIWDDIKAIPQVWRLIDRPKLDITSFGHFAGTGIVYWENR